MARLKGREGWATMITVRLPQRLCAPNLEYWSEFSDADWFSNFFRVTDLGNLFCTFGGIPIVAEGRPIEFYIIALLILWVFCSGCVFCDKGNVLMEFLSFQNPLPKITSWLNRGNQKNYIGYLYQSYSCPIPSTYVFCRS